MQFQILLGLELEENELNPKEKNQHLAQDSASICPSHVFAGDSGIRSTVTIFLQKAVILQVSWKDTKHRAVGISTLPGLGSAVKESIFTCQITLI